MGFFSNLGKSTYNLIELKKLDANSDRYIANNCGFNPLMASLHTRVRIYEYIKNLYKSGAYQLNDDEVTMIKLGIYAKEFDEFEHPAKYGEIKKCINKLYAKGEDKFSTLAIGEVLIHLDFDEEAGREEVVEESKEVDDRNSPFISCPKCKQKLNVPRGKKLEISCPMCKHVWVGLT